MKTFVALALAFASGTSAYVARDGSCCFGLTASGGDSGTVGQLSDGQNRVGGGLTAASYCIDSSGAITDQSGRGCILTPPTTQFQCDEGATPTPGFSVGCDGLLAANGSTTFYVCPTGDNNEDNIYTTPPSGQTACSTVTLTASNCKSGCPSSSPSPSPTPSPSSSSVSSATPSPTTSTSTSASPSPSSCPAALSGTYEYPHLIVPISSSSPDTAEGTSYNGTITPEISSIFNFDIPSSDSGKTCSLVFLFPEQSQLQTSSFSFSGPGSIDFCALSSTASSSTTYNNAPSVATNFGVTTVAPGNSYTIATFSCPANTAVSYELKSVGGTSLNYFQDYNPSPIGLYITVC